MKTVVLYYSYSGGTRAAATRLAQSEGAALAEIRDIRRPSKVRAYAAGCFGALRGTAWKSQPLDRNLAEFERIIVCSPIWAGNTPPVVNGVLNALPQGKAVAFKLFSASGESACAERLTALVTSRGCTSESIENIKSGGNK